MEHNYSEEIANTRDTFLSSEIEYLKDLSQTTGFIELYSRFHNVDASVLSTRLLTLTQMMENGEVKEEDEKKVELEIMCLCLAIKDAVKTLGAKKLTPNHETEEHNTLNRM
jgi:hypothetical protein